MKAIRTSTIALAGALLVAAGALTGCSSSSNDTGSSATAATQAADTNASGSNGGGSGDWCHSYDATKLATITDPQGLLDWWKGQQASAPAAVKDDYTTIVDYYTKLVNDPTSAATLDATKLADAQAAVAQEFAKDCS